MASAFSLSSQTDQKKLIGKWTWIESSGGFAGEITSPVTEKYEIQVEFTKKGIYSEWKDKQNQVCSKYEIKKGKSMFSEEERFIITYIPKQNTNSTLISDSFEILGNDTLVLKNECHDCFSRVFVRKK